MSFVHVQRAGYITTDRSVYYPETPVKDYSTTRALFGTEGLGDVTIVADAPTTEPSGLSFEVSQTSGIMFQPSTAWAFSTGNFTIEGWFKIPVSRAGDNQWMDFRNGKSARNFFLVFRTLTPAYYDGTFKSATSAMTANTWTHIAWVRSASGMEIYMAGNRVRTAAAFSAGGTLADPISFQTGTLAAYTCTTRYSQIRIQAEAVYSGATYTVPTSKLAIDANTRFYLNPQKPGGVRQAGAGYLWPL